MNDIAPVSPLTRPAGFPQQPFDVAVVMPTVLRPHLRQALQSVYTQDVGGTIQILVGIDKALGNRSLLDELIAAAPAHIHVTVIDPGYSTSMRHGGMHSCFYGGALRTVLSYLANSRYVAYLDDDDWFAPDHLSSLLRAVQGRAWAYSLRWYGHPEQARGLCIDRWESRGPQQGVYAASGGFVAPSCLMLDKIQCAMALSLWSVSPFSEGDGEDRLILGALANQACAGTGKATSFYTLDPNDGNHALRLKWMRDSGVATSFDWQTPKRRLIGRKARQTIHFYNDE